MKQTGSLNKRVIAVFFVMTLISGGLIVRLSYIIADTELSAASGNQSSYLMEVDDSRGVIYDCNMLPLVNNDEYFTATVVPSPEAAAVILPAVEQQSRDSVLDLLADGSPFMYNVGYDGIYSKGVDVFSLYNRYSDEQTAVHIIGSTDSSGTEGISGIEAAADDYLSSVGGSIKIRYSTAAGNTIKSGTSGDIIDTGYYTKSGVVLTIDNRIQTITEKAAQSIDVGSVVVMDIHTGDIKASVSRPIYNPNDIASVMESENSPLINRAFYEYSVGSTFKTLVAATALEQGFSVSREHTCNGYIEVDGRVIKCGNLAGHGEVDMVRAMEVSCNPYFISLALEIGGETLAYKAEQIGVGTASEFLAGYRTMSGALPEYDNLASDLAVANLGFGQGDLMMTPIQLASLMSTIANGGQSVVPRLVMGYSSDGFTVDTPHPIYQGERVFTEEASKAVQTLMQSVVENGSGVNAKPDVGSAGGKTASAQTGQYIDGEEVIHAWFAGFYPADNPKYAIAVLVEGGESGSNTAAPVFKEICDEIEATKFEGK